MLSATFHSPKKGSVDTSLWIQTEQCLRTSAKGDNRSTHLHPNTLHYLLQAGRSHQKIWTLFIAKKICELIGGKKRGMLHTFKRLLWHMALPRVGCGASFVPRVFLPMKYCLIIWPKCRLFYLLLPSSLYRGLVNSCVSVWTHFVQPLQWRFLCTGPFWFCLRGGGPASWLTLFFCSLLSQVEAILVNIFGGIVNCAIIANGITKACRELELKVPLVVRLEGIKRAPPHRHTHTHTWDLFRNEDLIIINIITLHRKW